MADNIEIGKIWLVTSQKFLRGRQTGELISALQVRGDHLDNIQITALLLETFQIRSHCGHIMLHNQVV